MFILRQTTHRMVIRHDARIGHLWVRNQIARIPHERGAYLVRTNEQGFRSDRDFESQRTGMLKTFGAMHAGRDPQRSKPEP